MALKPVVFAVVLPALGVLGACGGNEAGTVCGDGIVEGAEACDDGNAATEACAYGQTSCVVCDSGCQEVAGVPHVCGDAVVDDPGVLEQCDDGFVDACGTCNATCSGPGTGSTCGDGVICPETELCDDGAQNSATARDACRPTCVPAGCGDHVVDSGEECDDGATEPLDGCSAVCAIEPGDDCSDLFDLVAMGGQGNGTYVFRHDTRLLTRNYVAPVFGSCVGKTANWQDAVAVFTAPAAGSWTFATTNSFDVVLWITTSCAPGTWNILACVDDAGYPAAGPSAESTTVTLTEGQTVYVFVDGWDSMIYANAGTFTLTVTSP